MYIVINMKVIFINNKQNVVFMETTGMMSVAQTLSGYTIDKIYEAKQSPIMVNMYLVADDYNIPNNILKSRFQTLAEYRQQRLNELLNEDI